MAKTTLFCRVVVVIVVVVVVVVVVVMVVVVVVVVVLVEHRCLVNIYYHAKNLSSSLKID